MVDKASMIKVKYIKLTFIYATEFSKIAFAFCILSNIAYEIVWYSFHCKYMSIHELTTNSKDETCLIRYAPGEKFCVGTI